MAKIPLRLVEWYYDEEDNRVEASFEETAPLDHPDPVNFRPQRFFTIQFLPQETDSEVRVLEAAPLDPPAPEPSPEVPDPTPEQEDSGGPEEAPTP